MVYMYGGGFTKGASDGFVPSPMVDQGDVVVVTINYRLGWLGCLAHPARHHRERRTPRWRPASRFGAACASCLRRPSCR
jgi:carboxylesterase type B